MFYSSHFNPASIPRTARNQFMSRSSMTAILLRPKRATPVLSLVPLGSIWTHWPLSSSETFFSLACMLFHSLDFPSPLTAFFIVCYYQVSCWRNLVHGLFSSAAYIFSLGGLLWFYAFTHHLYPDDLYIYLHPWLLPWALVSYTQLSPWHLCLDVYYASQTQKPQIELLVIPAIKWKKKSRSNSWCISLHYCNIWIH